MRQTRLLIAVPLAVATLIGCRTAPETDVVYRPTESVLEVVSLLQLHIDDDTYRFSAARDFTGKNVYRASLERLESLEEIYVDKFRSGYITDVILFAKGRALERLGEYELAERHYVRVTDLQSILVEDAERGSSVCGQLREARSILPDPGGSRDEAVRVFDRRAARLEKLLAEVRDSHYAAVVREEIERADLDRARYFRALRSLDPRLDTVALQQYQHLIQNHRRSKLQNRHLLELGDLYVELARDYAHRSPPVSLGFDAATFDEYAFGATRLYEAVAHQDGAIEKIEASRKLEAFLAFTLGVRDESLH